MELIECVWSCLECGAVGGAGSSMLSAKVDARKNGWPEVKQHGKPSELSVYCKGCLRRQRRRAQGERV